MKKILLVASVAFLMGCNATLPTPTPVPTATASPSPEPTFTLVPTATVPARTATPTPIGFTSVSILPFNGKLPDQLAAEARKAAALGQIPVIEFDASW